MDTVFELQRSQPNNYHFLFSPKPNTIFLGASPEKLFSQSGSILKTEALAGTRSVSRDQSENESLTRRTQPKYKRSNRAPYCRSLYSHTIEGFVFGTTQFEQEVLQLPHVQHLRTPIECILHPNTTTEQLLDRLHPTPRCMRDTKTYIQSVHFQNSNLFTEDGTLVQWV